MTNNTLALHILSALLIGISYCHPYLGFFIFIALIPLIYSKCFQNYKQQKITLILLQNFLFSLILNFVALSWALNGDTITGLFLISANIIIVFIPLFIFDLSVKFLNLNRLWTFYFCWLSYEIISLNWQFNFPWLILGNLLSKYPYLMQWYEYTGAIGGSAWILICNTIILKLILSKKASFVTILSLSIPFLISLNLWNSNFKSEELTPRNVLLIQPNIEPRYEKKNISKILQFIKVIKLIESNKDSINYLVLPETFLSECVPINEINSLLFFSQINNLAPHNSEDFLIFLGANLSQMDSFKNNEYFNSIIAHNGIEVKTIYNKNKFIPFVERVPYKNIWNYEALNKVELFFECAKYSDRKIDLCHKSINGDKIASFVCYEGLFGEYIAGIMQNTQSQLIVVSSNEGWWNQSYFNDQFLNFLKLRSIENRKWLVKCSNTGISAVINPRGEVIRSIEFGKSDILKQTIYLNDKKTFYMIWGDLFCYITLIILFVLIVTEKFYHSF